MKSRNMPTIDSIKQFWSSRFSKPFWLHRKPNLGSELLHEDFCWACGVSGHRLERAHIVGRILVKSDEKRDSEKNIHLLCVYCHCDSEGMGLHEYFRWFRDRKFAEGVKSAEHKIMAAIK